MRGGREESIVEAIVGVCDVRRLLCFSCRRRVKGASEGLFGETQADI